MFGAIVKGFVGGVRVAKKIVGDNAPEILFVAGVVGVVGSVVLACKATLDVEKDIDKKDERMADVQKKIEKQRAEGLEEEALEELKQQLEAGVTYHFYVDLVKRFGLAAVLLLISLGMLGGSHYIMSAKAANYLALAVSTAEASKMYQQRVIDDQGMDKHLEYLTGMKATEEMVEAVLEDEEKPRTVKKFVSESYPDFEMTASAFAKPFLPTNAMYDTCDPAGPLKFVWIIEKQMNRKLKSKGYVFLNEVYEALNIEQTQMGNEFGWKYERDGSNDGHIDIVAVPCDYLDEFGQRHTAYMLDFNVDHEPLKKRVFSNKF